MNRTNRLISKIGVSLLASLCILSMVGCAKKEEPLGSKKEDWKPGQPPKGWIGPGDKGAPGQPPSGPPAPSTTK